MAEIEQELKDFLGYWFAGWMRGMQTLDDASQKIILSECGKACAQSHTIQVFRQAKQNSLDMETFLQELSSKDPAYQFERTGPNTIQATYSRCGCDLVRLGLVTSPTLCECSAVNLQENLQESLGKTVSIAIESSILRGGSRCVLRATFDDEMEFGQAAN